MIEHCSFSKGAPFWTLKTVPHEGVHLPTDGTFWDSIKNA
jgi:hypothetical protein